MKFYQKHHLDKEKVALDFGLDRVNPLVSMATDSSHRVLIEKTVMPLFLSFFHPILFILAGNENMHGSSKDLGIQPDRTTDCGVNCP